MDQQSSNGANNQNAQGQNTALNNIQAQKAPANSKPQSEQNKPNNQDKRFDRNQGQDKRSKAQSNNHEKNRNQGDSKYRSKDHKERGRTENGLSAKQNHNHSPNNNVTFHSNNSRYGKSAYNSSSHGENSVRSIKTKRIETIEDIQADIERIDKEIQFEIKQIKSVKLGL